ncbi:MAG: MOSC domain-containing protein [Chloroflexota bacterium]|nr:MOSC domain-containing protein [Chloroflexota bacterium]
MNETATAAIILSVSRKETPGLPKIVRDEIKLIAAHGVEGDYHAGAVVRHRSRAARTPELPNRRQVHLMHSELFAEVAALGINVTPGQMGENITTRGLALFDLTVGTKLHLGDTAVVEVTGLRNPCNQLDAVDRRLLAQVAIKCDDGSIIRKAGIMGIVLEGGTIRPGDAIRVEISATAARLEPV